MRRKWAAIGAVVIAAGVLLLAAAMPSKTADGVLEGLKLAAGVFIPAMLPYYFSASFICSTEAANAVKKIFLPLCSMLRLNAAAGSVVFLGLVGGYPAGAIAAAQLVKTNALSDSDGRRLLTFCVNPGPGFVIAAVGKTLLGSRLHGILLFSSGIIASTLIAVGGILFSKRYAAKNASSAAVQPDLKPLGVLDGFCVAVENAAKACLLAAGSISLMTGLATAFAAAFGRSPFLSAFFEVTGGVYSLSEAGLPFLLAAALGWSGLGVIIQICAISSKFCPAWVIFSSRVAHALLSAIIAALLFALFPIGEQQPATTAMAALQRNQIPSALIMMLCGFVLCVANFARSRYNNAGGERR